MIRPMEPADREAYLAMCRAFYDSDAVLHPVPDAYFQRTFDVLMAGSPYAEGYIIEQDGKTAGYALLAKSFSQEAGGIVIWIEEIYILPEFQSRGLGTAFFRYLEEHRTTGVKRFRLEYEPDNLRGAALYRRLGFSVLEYGQMIKEFA